MTTIDLVWITADNTAPPAWPLGTTLVVAPTPAALSKALGQHRAAAPFLLLWDAALGEPSPERIRQTTDLPGDVWHAGLRLGTAGLPTIIDHLDPVWRFNRDPDPAIVATSWRISWRACLLRTSVLGQLGGLDPRFDSLDAAALEMGHRWIMNGAMMRHVPKLVETNAPAPTLALVDEFRFARARYGRMWSGWALWRRVRTGGPAFDCWRAFRAAGRGVAFTAAAPYRREPATVWEPSRHDPTVSILIPTLDRYPTLFALLAQLREQTVPPLEIIVIDQTDAAARQTDWPAQFSDLPLRVIRRDTAGQCSSRNAGLQTLRGDTILFLDDDDEVPPDLIARHLAYLAERSVDASCGIAEEVGAGELPYHFTYERDSDVFPTNNSLLRREALRGSGLFDMAYERGERADGDLGMRLYLSGALLGLNPAAWVLHLHAPRGGLRQHKARVVTYAGSKGSLTQRHLLAPTEGYLWSRYFSPRQVHEALLIRTIGTLRGTGHALRRLARAATMAAMLPDTWRQNKARLALGTELFNDYPLIPVLQPDQAERIL